MATKKVKAPNYVKVTDEVKTLLLDAKAIDKSIAAFVKAHAKALKVLDNASADPDADFSQSGNELDMVREYLGNAQADWEDVVGRLQDTLARLKDDEKNYKNEQKRLVDEAAREKESHDAESD